jgi:hypothetical protein
MLPVNRATSANAHEPITPGRSGVPLGLAACLGLTLSAWPTEAALMVIAEFANQPDTVPGQDLWQGSYRLEGADFLNGQGFTIYFDHQLFANLLRPLTPVNAGWDVLLIQPDLGLPDAGFLDGLATTDHPSLLDPFVVEFQWLGTGRPVSQAIEMYDLNGGFSIIGGGSTVVIPESTSVAMVFGGAVLGLAILRRLFGGR